MGEDQDHLRHYAETGAEDAFSALVRVYLPLVYGAALRRLGGDTHRAQDVAQLVFTALARNARALVRHPDLTGWLFTTTRFLAVKTLRGERRRVTREQAAARTLDTMNAEPPVDKSDVLHTVVDDALAELRQVDRRVILLRFHRGMRLASIGILLGTSENAVQKRLDRALEELREKLARRGITSTAAAVAVALNQQGSIAVPTGLAAAAIAAGLAGSATSGGLLAGGASLLAASKLQVAAIAIGLAALGGALLWQMRENRTLRETETAQTEAAGRRMVVLRQELATLTERTAIVQADAAKLEKAIRAASVSTGTPPARTLTDDRARWDAAQKRGQQLIQQGKPQEALDVYLECYRELSQDRGGIERQILMSSIKRLGETYHPANTALHTLRDAALQRVAANFDDRHAISEVAVLNERLGDSRSSMRLHDLLPPGHPGRQTLALIAQKAFVEERRYQDALIGEPFGNMLTNFDRSVNLANKQPSGPLRDPFRHSAVAGVLNDIEILTGAGKHDEARKLTEKLLAFDGSDETRAALKRHVERATQSPGL